MLSVYQSQVAMSILHISHRVKTLVKSVVYCILLIINRRITMQNVFAITQKSINHFINMFSSTNNTLEDYVRTEYKPTDWKWAYQKFVLQNKKK